MNENTSNEQYITKTDNHYENGQPEAKLLEKMFSPVSLLTSAKGNHLQTTAVIIIPREHPSYSAHRV